MGAYHEAHLSALLQQVCEAMDSFRAGAADAFEVDRVVFQYSRSAQELWKFCNGTDVEFTARLIRESEPFDWWQRGALRSR